MSEERDPSKYRIVVAAVSLRDRDDVVEYVHRIVNRSYALLTFLALL